MSIGVATFVHVSSVVEFTFTLSVVKAAVSPVSVFVHELLEVLASRVPNKTKYSPSEGVEVIVFVKFRQSHSSCEHVNSYQSINVDHQCQKKEDVVDSL